MGQNAGTEHIFKPKKSLWGSEDKISMFLDPKIYLSIKGIEKKGEENGIHV